jgi:hypothetical protein
MEHAMGNATVDPVHGTRYEFEHVGEDMLVDTWMEAGGGLPKHYHPKQTEIWWVVSGEVTVHFDGEWKPFTPDTGKVEVTPHIVHGFKNESGAEAHLRCEVKPALSLEEFLTEASRAAREGLFMKGGIPKSFKGARWAAGFLARHEDETVMTFPPRFMQKAMKPLAPKG